MAPTMAMPVYRPRSGMTSQRGVGRAARRASGGAARRAPGTDPAAAPAADTAAGCRGCGRIGPRREDVEQRAGDVEHEQQCGEPERRVQIPERGVHIGPQVSDQNERRVFSWKRPASEPERAKNGAQAQTDHEPTLEQGRALSIARALSSSRPVVSLGAFSDGRSGRRCWLLSALPAMP